MIHWFLLHGLLCWKAWAVLLLLLMARRTAVVNDSQFALSKPGQPSINAHWMPLNPIESWIKLRWANTECCTRVPQPWNRCGADLQNLLAVADHALLGRVDGMEATIEGCVWIRILIYFGWLLLVGREKLHCQDCWIHWRPMFLR